MNSERSLIDTTVWVLYFKGEESVENRVKSLILEDRAVTTEIVILETLRGARAPNEYEQLYHDLKALPLLPTDAAAWEESYKMGFELRRAGVNVPLADLLIAVLATRYACLLLHRDKHFPLIKEIAKLREMRILVAQFSMRSHPPSVFLIPP